MASGSFRQPRYTVTSSGKTKPRSVDKETKSPKKGANAVVTKVKKGWTASSDGSMKR